jgi:hypothetical protein
MLGHLPAALCLAFLASGLLAFIVVTAAFILRLRLLCSRSYVLLLRAAGLRTTTCAWCTHVLSVTGTSKACQKYLTTALFVSAIRMCLLQVR